MNEQSRLTAARSSKVYEWLALCATKNIVRRALFTSVIVGTILVIINHGDALLHGNIDTARVLRIILTYMVPYMVSTTSSVSAIMNLKNSQLLAENRNDS